MQNEVETMIRQICGILDYDPEEPKYQRLVLMTLNRHFLPLMEMRPWLFAQTRTTITVRPDYTVGTINLALNSTAVSGLLTVWTRAMEGSHLLAPDGQWYRIARFISTTSLVLESTYKGANITGQTYTIRARAYPMPGDFVDFEGITARGTDKRPIAYITPAQEEKYPLVEADGTGPVSCYTDADPYVPRAPDLPPLLVASTAAGALLQNTAYRYRYTWSIAGVETAPSPVAEIETDSTQNVVTLSRILEVGTATPRIANVYRSEGEGQPFYFIVALTSATMVDDGSTAPTKDVPIPAAKRKYIRFWPMPSTLEAVEMRYHFRGTELQGPADTVPEEICKAVVDRTLGDLFKKVGDIAGASFYNKRAQEVVDDCMARHLSHDNQVVVREPWIGDGGRVFNIGPIVKT